MTVPTSLATRISASLALLALGLLALPAGAQGGPPVAAKTIDGIPCQSMEGAVFHIHQHLSILDHGTPVAIPGDMGQVAGTCLYWIHTHTPDGIIHIESPIFRTFTLGNLFDIWQQPLSSTAVASAKINKGQLKAYVNGKPYTGDPRKIELAQHTDITLEAGPPYAKPAPFTNWGGN